jgi:hypothetical protein
VTTIMGTLPEGQCAVLVISRSVLLRMKNISDKFVRKIKSHLMFSIFLNHAVYEIMWKKYCRSGQATQREYGVFALHAGYLRLQIHTQYM